MTLTVLTCCMTFFLPSVSVTHDVILAIPNTANSDKVYDDVLETVEDAVVGLVNCTAGKAENQYLHKHIPCDQNHINFFAS